MDTHGHSKPYAVILGHSVQLDCSAGPSQTFSTINLLVPRPLNSAIDFWDSSVVTDFWDSSVVTDFWDSSVVTDFYNSSDFHTH
jgi:hypothetical protein